MVIDKNDWRLEFQDDRLKGKKLIHTQFVAKLTRRDHAHCEFCFEKFMDNEPKTLHVGYCALDREHWICETCFNDFKDKFQWTVVKSDANITKTTE